MRTYSSKRVRITNPPEVWPADAQQAFRQRPYFLTVAVVDLDTIGLLQQERVIVPRLAIDDVVVATAELRRLSGSPFTGFASHVVLRKQHYEFVE